MPKDKVIASDELKNYNDEYNEEFGADATINEIDWKINNELMMIILIYIKLLLTQFHV